MKENLQKGYWKYVKEHINSIPREVSHYSRTKSSKYYFSPDLNINWVYKKK